MLIAAVFVTITLVFWDVAIAVQVYDTPLVARYDNIDPKRFGIIQNSSEEYVFTRSVGERTGWHTYATNAELYKALANTTNGIDSSVVYELFHRYSVNQNPDLCENLRVYEYVPNKLVHNRSPPRISGGFFSSNNPLSSRTEIDRAIANLKDKGRILKILKDIAGNDLKDKCKIRTTKIGWLIFALLHVVITGLPSAALVIWILCATWRRRREIRRSYEKDEETPRSDIDKGLTKDEFQGSSSGSRLSGASSEKRRYTWNALRPKPGFAELLEWADKLWGRRCALSWW